VQRKGSAPVAVIVGVRRLDFADAAEMVAAACDDRPVRTIDEATFDAIPSGPDPLYAATDRTIDVGRISPDGLFYRKDCRFLRRLDDRAPDSVFLLGFQPKDRDGEYDLSEYVLHNYASPFVSTTYRDDLYRTWGVRWQYLVQVPGGIDVNGTIGDDHQYADQEEVAFPGGIRSRFIVEACPIDLETAVLIEEACVENPAADPW